MEQLTKVVKDLFFNRNDVYAMQLEGLNEYSVIKEKISLDLIKKHLQGRQTIGSFQINPITNKVKWICFDFDVDENSSLEIEFEKAKNLLNKLKNKGFHPLLEFSGRRGYHIWLFIEPTDASIAKKFAEDISHGIKVHEIFPKQEKLDKNKFGAMVKIPLGIHMASNKWSYFFDDNLEKLGMKESQSFIMGRENKIDKIINKEVLGLSGHEHKIISEELQALQRYRIKSKK